MPIDLTKNFVAHYRLLPDDIRAKVDNAILSIKEADFRHPGQHAERIEGVPGIYELALDLQYKLTLERGSDAIILRNVENYIDCLRRS